MKLIICHLIRKKNVSKENSRRFGKYKLPKKTVLRDFENCKFQISTKSWVKECRFFPPVMKWLNLLLTFFVGVGNNAIISCCLLYGSEFIVFNSLKTSPVYPHPTHTHTHCLWEKRLISKRI